MLFSPFKYFSVDKSQKYAIMVVWDGKNHPFVFIIALSKIACNPIKPQKGEKIRHGKGRAFLG
jgi:hypothetical protein